MPPIIIVEAVAAAGVAVVEVEVARRRLLVAGAAIEVRAAVIGAKVAINVA